MNFFNRSAPTANRNSGGIRTSDRDDFFSIHGYLERCENVAPVKLPEKYLVAGGCSDHSSFSPLILDGASGVGKTHQAFVLLKNGKERLVYVLMSPRHPNDQRVYRQMRDFTRMDYGLDFEGKFLDLLDMAMKDAKNAAAKDEDAYGPVAIEESLKKPKRYIYIAKLKEFLSKRVITYSCGDEEESERLEIHAPHESVHDNLLEGTVLFIDEALAPLDKSRETETIYDRLRFMQSFGRVSGMRTVLAGTGSTTANINKWVIPPSSSSSKRMVDSRCGTDKVLWAEVEFLNPHVDHQIKVKKVDNENEETVDVKLRVRPLLKEWLSEIWLNGKKVTSYDSIYDAIFDIKQEVISCKYLSDESIVMWISGACLASKQNTSSAFRLKSSHLVRFNFFEPAILINSTEDEYLGKSIETIRRRQGPLRLRLFKGGEDDDNGWDLVVAEENGLSDDRAKSITVSRDFSDIEYALSHCVQQCLGIEPLLALALSTLSEFSAEKFHSVFDRAFPEIVAHISKGELDGELNGLVMFAALQLASKRKSYRLSTHSVRKCITRLDEYLRFDPSDEKNRYKYSKRYDFTWKHERPVSTHTVKESVDDSDSCLESKQMTDGTKSDNMSTELTSNDDGPERERQSKLLDDTKMPWLVPACTLTKLQQSFETELGGPAQLQLFDDLRIAGLIPGDDMDADAYMICGTGLEKAWTFEFKCHKGYTLTDGCSDLVEKCEGGVEKCHGMLIAISGEEVSSQCQWWVEEDEYLRVVLIVGNLV